MAYPLPLIDFIPQAGYTPPANGAFPQQDPNAYGAGTVFDPNSAPIGIARPNTVLPYNPQTNQIAKQQTGLGYAAAIQGGLGAGAQVSATPDAGDAVLQTFGSAASGAATGAAMGSMVGGVGAVPGAVVGGLTGLVSGGIQSYMGVKSSRRQRREQERVFAEIQRRQDAKDAQARSDEQESIRYNRRQNAIQSQMSAFQLAMQLQAKAMAEEERMKTTFIERGR